MQACLKGEWLPQSALESGISLGIIRPALVDTQTEPLDMCSVSLYEDHFHFL